VKLCLSTCPETIHEFSIKPFNYWFLVQNPGKGRVSVAFQEWSKAVLPAVISSLLFSFFKKKKKLLVTKKSLLRLEEGFK